MRLNIAFKIRYLFFVILRISQALCVVIVDLCKIGFNFLISISVILTGFVRFEIFDIYNFIFDAWFRIVIKFSDRRSLDSFIKCIICPLCRCFINRHWNRIRSEFKKRGFKYNLRYTGALHFNDRFTQLINHFVV